MILNRQAKAAADLVKVQEQRAEFERKKNLPPEVKISAADYQLLQQLKQQQLDP